MLHKLQRSMNRHAFVLFICRWQAALSCDAADNSEMEQVARARLQGGSLLQADMAAFKAANPACQLADFVRWHSPKDWQPDPTHAQGGSLSDRMSRQVC